MFGFHQTLTVNSRITKVHNRQVAYTNLHTNILWMISYDAITKVLESKLFQARFCFLRDAFQLTEFNV